MAPDNSFANISEASDEFNRKIQRLFEESLGRNKNLSEALAIVQENSPEGGRWIIGGSVYREIAAGLGGASTAGNFDYDFVVEKAVALDRVHIPEGWESTKTGLGSLRLVNGNRQIDIVPLDSAIEIECTTDAANMTVVEKLESYFRRVPLNVQAIMYDTAEKKVFGDIGLAALREKVVRVNNLDECLRFCARSAKRRISVCKFIQLKAESLGFTPEFPSFENEETKQATTAFYDRHAEVYSQRRDDITFYEEYFPNELRALFGALKQGGKIMDIGSGPGGITQSFQEAGFDSIALDLSAKMVEKCRARGLTAIQGDIESLDFPDESLDGALAIASLLHVPRMRIQNAIARIKEVLKPSGVFFVSMTEGDGEVMHESSYAQGDRRFFVGYHHDEFKEILERYFKVTTSKRAETRDGKVYLVYLCQKQG
ncbi:MAG: class I SAM-dependent methyltransferase [bacterium]|nr:class I SAM-dependent methyltransferase [bacterium]